MGVMGVNCVESSSTNGTVAEVVRLRTSQSSFGARTRTLTSSATVRRFGARTRTLMSSATVKLILLEHAELLRVQLWCGVVIARSSQ
jgi:hypothetical protein